MYRERRERKKPKKPNIYVYMQLFFQLKDYNSLKEPLIYLHINDPILYPTNHLYLRASDVGRTERGIRYFWI